MITPDQLSAWFPSFIEPTLATQVRVVDINTGRVYRINDARTGWVEDQPHLVAGRTLGRSLDVDQLAYQNEVRAEARTHVPPAGGMTRDEIADAYADDPGKAQALYRELDERGM